MLDLYRAFKDDIPGCPIDQSVGRIFYHAAWCSIVYKLNLFSEYPEMLQMIRKTSVGRSNLLPLWQQLFVRICVGLNYIR